MANILPIPFDTREIFQKEGAVCDNAYLLLNRFLEGEDNVSDKPFDTKNTKLSLYEKLQNISFDTTSHVKRQTAILAGLKKSGAIAKPIELVSESRLVVGLGDTNALEVGMTLHPLYGFPFIPGSTIKGLTRSWLEVAEDTFEGKTLDGEELNKTLKEKSFDVFGSLVKDSTSLTKDEKAHYEKLKMLNRMGQVTFLDAIPVTDNEHTIAFDIDIMNPHYSSYYSNPESNPPGDWYSPVPILFLTLKRGIKFQFGLIAEDEDLYEQAADWLKMGLSELGIGAKTSSGYGFFTHPEELKRREAEERRIEEEARPDWAKEDKKKLQIALKKEEALTEAEKIEKEIFEGPPSLKFHKAYILWEKIDDDDEKLRLAKLFFEVDNKYMKGKKKKPWARELMEYVKKHTAL